MQSEESPGRSVINQKRSAIGRSVMQSEEKCNREKCNAIRRINRENAINQKRNAMQSEESIGRSAINT
ncbi:hypothetical protein A2U01_0058942 [Trifolium medium]|uniref:Uncharacterized protein n=1 Tax=Trifolium medium TaxID=97028 RepID=A0A392RQ83_9FABA|nr:hypothetical protein [Trifolium medium]